MGDDPMQWEIRTLEEEIEVLTGEIEDAEKHLSDLINEQIKQKEKLRRYREEKINE